MVKIKNRFFLTFILVVILLIGITFWQKNKVEEEKQQEVHYHAGFQIYINDELQDFSDLKYMHIVPCGEDEQVSEEHEQIEKAHLHDNIGDVVHVHRNGAVWGDLLINIGFPILLNYEPVGYVNGELVENILNYPINSYDTVLIFQGTLNDLNSKLENTVTREHIEEAETKSESC